MSSFTMLRYIDNSLTELHLDSVNTITLNWQGLTRTSQFLSSILAEVIPDKPCLAWRNLARTNQLWNSKLTQCLVVPRITTFTTRGQLPVAGTNTMP